MIYDINYALNVIDQICILIFSRMVGSRTGGRSREKTQRDEIRSGQRRSNVSRWRGELCIRYIVANENRTIEQKHNVLTKSNENQVLIYFLPRETILYRTLPSERMKKKGCRMKVLPRVNYLCKCKRKIDWMEEITILLYQGNE